MMLEILNYIKIINIKLTVIFVVKNIKILLKKEERGRLTDFFKFMTKIPSR